MKAQLIALGLSTYEAAALTALVAGGPQQASQLAGASKIPVGRIYDTLDQLQERGLIRHRPGRPKTYFAVEPQSIPDRVMAARRLHLQSMAEQAEEDLDALRTEVKLLAAGSEPGSYDVKVGQNAARQLLVERTNEAQGEVIAFLGFDVLEDDDMQIFDAFRQAVRRGVNTRLLLREADVDYLMGTPYVAAVLDAMLPFLGSNLQVRLSGAESIPFAVLDHEKVVIGVRDPADPIHYFAVVQVDEAGYAKRLATRFNDLWEEAGIDPGLFRRVLRRLEDEGDTRTSRFLRAMIQRGAKRASKKAKKSGQ